MSSLELLFRDPLLLSTHEWPATERLKGILVTLAIFLTFGLLPFLWAEVHSVPSIVWTATSTALMSGAVLACRVHEKAEPRTLALAAIFFGLYFLGSLFSFLFVTQEHSERADTFLAHCVLMILGAIYFGFGVATGSRPSTLGFILAYLGIAGYAILASESFSVHELAERYNADQLAIGYQQMGDALTISSLIIMSQIRRVSFVYVVALATIVLLFVVPSRSSAVFGSVAVLAYCMLISTPRVRVLIVVVSVLAAVSWRAVIVQGVSQKLEGSRHETLLTPEEDTSYTERMAVLDGGLDSIWEHPIAGYFGFQLDRFGNAGLYLHNFLDIWAQGGLLPFLAFVGLWVFIIRQWYLLYRHDREAALRTTALLFFAALSWGFARSPGSAMLFFCLGYFAAVLLRSFGAASHERVATQRPN